MGVKRFGRAQREGTRTSNYSSEPGFRLFRRRCGQGILRPNDPVAAAREECA